MLVPVLENFSLASWRMIEAYPIESGFDCHFQARCARPTTAAASGCEAASVRCAVRQTCECVQKRTACTPHDASVVASLLGFIERQCQRAHVVLSLLNAPSAPRQAGVALLPNRSLVSAWGRLVPSVLKSLCDPQNRRWTGCCEPASRLAIWRSSSSAGRIAPDGSRHRAGQAHGRQRSRDDQQALEPLRRRLVRGWQERPEAGAAAHRA